MHSQKALLSNKEGKVIVDYVGRFEELQKHFDIVCEKIGVKADLPHKKFLKEKKPYQHYYSEKSRIWLLNSAKKISTILDTGLSRKNEKLALC